MKPLANMRKAVAGQDDGTLTRWIKEPGRHSGGRPTPLMPQDATGTRFKSRVLPVAAMSRLLVSGHSNVKIGRDVRKGRLKGYWIFTLSLEERKTCPPSCNHWRTCYGNAMPFAKRIDHTDPTFLPALAAEIARLVRVRGRKGVLIRLHALGDFYSTDYVDFWRQQLDLHPTLSVFGYTARRPDLDGIAAAIDRLKAHYGLRFAIRWSNGRNHWTGKPLKDDCTVSIKTAEDCPPGAFVCPEQTGATRCCATCGLCWTTTRNVAFVEHR